MAQPREYAPTTGEEMAHAITHGVGAIFAAAGMVALVVAASAHRTTAHVAACAVYGASMVLLYLASTVFHAVPARLARAKRFLNRCDHAAIYLLIAGTYTPFTVLAMDNDLGARVFVVIWGLAALGLLSTALSLRPLDARAQRNYERRSLALYLSMGWLAVVALKPLLAALPSASFALLVAGGLAYTAGVAFFVSTRKWAHSIWHGFVLAGTGCHFGAIWLIV